MRTLLAVIMCLAAACLPAVAAPAEAPPETLGVALGAKAGTLGPGAEMTFYWADWVNMRLAANYLALEVEQDISDFDIDSDLTWASAGALIDLYPFAGNFRMSGGLFLNKNEIEGDGVPSEPQTIGDIEFTPEQIGTISAMVEFNDFAPYIGIGYGNAVGLTTRWSFSFDLGVLFQGSPELELSSSGGEFSQNQFFLEELQQEEDSLEDDAEPYKIYPVLSFGAAYQF